eukprot:3387673-Amphidinium_carterae.1
MQGQKLETSLPVIADNNDNSDSGVGLCQSRNTYGMTKACGELLVNDYTRKGHADEGKPKFVVSWVKDESKTWIFLLAVFHFLGILVSGVLSIRWFHLSESVWAIAHAGFVDGRSARLPTVVVRPGGSR